MGVINREWDEKIRSKSKVKRNAEYKENTETIQGQVFSRTISENSRGNGISAVS
jgi:hypothetical protein